MAILGSVRLQLASSGVLAHIAAIVTHARSHIC